MPLDIRHLPLEGQAARGPLGQTSLKGRSTAVCLRNSPLNTKTRPEESEAVTAEPHSRESIRIARTTRCLEQDFGQVLPDGVFVRLLCRSLRLSVWDAAADVRKRVNFSFLAAGCLEP